jgi:hypothetical protein
MTAAAVSKADDMSDEDLIRTEAVPVRYLAPMRLTCWHLGGIRLGLTSFGRSTAVPTGPGQRPSLPVRQPQSRRLGVASSRVVYESGLISGTGVS